MIFGKPDIGKREEDEVLKVLRSGWLGNGPKAREFEEEFGRYIGNPNCVAVNSCTMGLMLALRFYQSKHRNNILVVSTTPLTFAATVNAILQTKNIPTFSDVKLDGTLDPERIKPCDVIIPVHYTGTPCDMDEIKKKGVVIEDAAHGFGGKYNGRNLGTIGEFGVFSFYPTKNITSGEGGMVVCPGRKEALEIRILSNQGQSHNAYKRTLRDVEDFIMYPGFKGAMPDLNAAIGLSQLRKWPRLKEKRDKIFKIYEDAFGKKPEGHSHHLYTIQIKDRDKVRKELRSKGIPAGIHYKPLHLELAYKFLDYKKGDFPNAEKIGEETLSLPISSTMTEEEARGVVECLKNFTEVLA